MQCRQYRHQVSPLAIGHEQTLNCNKGYVCRMQHEDAVNFARALGQEFTDYDKTLEWVKVFKCLGRLLAFNSRDVHAMMRGNLSKVQKCWAMISQVLRAENASSRVCGIFYKATAQAVPLSSNETSNLMPAVLKSLKGFHL